MIAADELLSIKARLIAAGNAARLIATSADPVMYDQEQYEFVHTALVSLGQDLSRVLAELDVLRGMVNSGVSLFLATEVSRGNGVSDAGRDVAGVPEAEAGSRGEGEPEVAAGAAGGVPSSRTPRKRAKRSKPRRDPAGDGAVQVELGSADGAIQVDRSQDT